MDSAAPKASSSDVLSLFVAALLFVRGVSDAGAPSGSNVFPATIINGAVAVILIALAIATRRPRTVEGTNSRMGLVFLAILSSTVIGIVVHGFQISMIQESVKWASIVALYGLTVSIQATSSTYKLFAYSKRSMFTLSVLVFVLGVAGVGFSKQLDGRYAGTLSHPNSASTLIGLSIIAFLVLDRNKNRAVTLLSTIILLASMLSTTSLGGTVSAVCGVVVWYAVRRENIFTSALAAALLASVSFLLITNFTTLSEKISFLDTESLGASANSLVAVNSGQWRIVNWKLLLDEWAKSPVFGHGLGSTTEVVAPLNAPPHSMIIQLLVETGVIGFSLVLLFSVGYFRKLIRNRRLENSSKGLALVAFVVSAGFASNLLLYTPTMYFLAVAFGLLQEGIRRENSFERIEEL